MNVVVNKEVKIGRIDEDKRQVEVVVRVPDIPDFDEDVTTAEEVVEMAHTFPFWGHVDAYHNFNRSGSFVESYVLKEDRVEELKNGRSMKTPKGTWIAVLQVDDLAIWENVKSGMITGASLVAIPGKTVTEDGDLISVREFKWQIDDVFRSNDIDTEEKLNRLNGIFSQKAKKEGAGGGTTLDAIKELGVGMEIICISLVKAPNQAEAQVVSTKGLNSIKDVVKTLIMDAVASIKGDKHNQKETEGEIMNKNDLVKLLKEDPEVLATLKEVLEDEAVEDVNTEEAESAEEVDENEAEAEVDSKEDESESVETEEDDEKSEDVEALTEKVKELTEKVKELTSVKSRAMDDAVDSEASKVTYKRKRKNGIGK